MFGRTVIHLLFAYLGVQSKLFVYVVSGAEVILSAYVAIALIATTENEAFVRYGVGISVCLYSFYAIIEFLIQKRAYERSSARAQVHSASSYLVLSMSDALRDAGAATVSSHVSSVDQPLEQAWYEAKIGRAHV